LSKRLAFERTIDRASRRPRTPGYDRRVGHRPNRYKKVRARARDEVLIAAFP
jgi:hypothetical protein